MATHRYPSTAPVFEVIGDVYCSEALAIGAHVVGVDFGADPGRRGVIGCRSETGEIDVVEMAWGFEAGELRPLTRAARDMLALVRR